MRTALIGYSGFVGSTLLSQTSFDDLFRSTNIEQIGGRHYDLLICAGAPAAKWKANQSPAEDLANIRRLIAALETTSADSAVLISTVDVYPMPVEVDEDTPIDAEAAGPYGRHRFFLEEFFGRHFRKSSTLRLPGLFGRGLRKNFLFDLIQNQQALVMTHHRSRFQFYDMSSLYADVLKVTANGLRLVNLATEPVEAGEVARRCFGMEFDNVTSGGPMTYDMRTKYADCWNSSQNYLMSGDEVLDRISAFARHEMGLNR